MQLWGASVGSETNAHFGTAQKDMWMFSTNFSWVFLIDCLFLKDASRLELAGKDLNVLLNSTLTEAHWTTSALLVTVLLPKPVTTDCHSYTTVYILCSLSSSSAPHTTLPFPTLSYIFYGLIKVELFILDNRPHFFCSCRSLQSTIASDVEVPRRKHLHSLLTHPPQDRVGLKVWLVWR